MPELLENERVLTFSKMESAPDLYNALVVDSKTDTIDVYLVNLPDLNIMVPLLPNDILKWEDFGVNENRNLIVKKLDKRIWLYDPWGPIECPIFEPVQYVSEDLVNYNL